MATYAGLIPCLVTLRSEFNAVSPGRDKGADGWIGDSSHSSTSDHSWDEDSDYLRDHDADSKNEVHALDIDSSGPWPRAGWFGDTIEALRQRERARWLDPNDRCRLKYIIFNHRIASQSTDFLWVVYNGSDPHTNHAHFSGRYETACENDTRPWGVQEDDMTKEEFTSWMTDWAKSSAGKAALSEAARDAVRNARMEDQGGGDIGNVNLQRSIHANAVGTRTELATLAGKLFPAEPGTGVKKLTEPGE